MDDRYFSAYGAQRVLVSLGGHLRDRGWTPTLVTGHEGPLTDLAATVDLPVRIVPIRHRLDVYGGHALRLGAIAKARTLSSLIRYSRDLERAYEDLGVDLVLANALRPLLYSVAARAKRRPVIWFLQGGEHFGAVSYAAPLIPHRIMTASQGALAAVPAPLRRFAQARSWVNSPGVETAGYRSGRGRPDELGLPDDRVIVLVAGSIEHRKGFDVAIEAVSMALADIPDLHLVVAGTARGPANEAYEARIRARADLLGVPVTFLGWVDDMAGVMACAHVFVLSSRLERLGLVTLEAMASGVPVIVTRAGGSEETVVDGESGILVEPDDPERLARALVMLWGDPDRRARLAAAGRRRVEERFTTDRFADRFVEDVERNLRPRLRRSPP